MIPRGYGRDVEVAALDQSTSAAEPPSVAQRCARNATLQDIAVLGLLAFLTARSLLARGPEAAGARASITALLAVASITVVAVRGELLGPGFWRALVYRVGLFAPMAGSYFALRALLPALHPVLLDPQLEQIDRVLFGQTPAMYFDRFVNPTSVEWFAFFYFSHWALLVVFIVGALAFDSGRRRYEVLLAAGLVNAIGYAIYTFVPGAGPFALHSLTFRHALVGGPWWARVLDAVHSAGASYDIFPSLHTALSVVIALHVIRHRRTPPMSLVWLSTSFVVINIVIATMFLRWHYGIDVLAGLALALFAHRVSIHMWDVEGAPEARAGRQLVWEPILPEAMDRADRHLLIGIGVVQLLALLALVAGT